MSRRIALLIPLLLVSACALTPEYQRPDIGTPAQWSGQQDTTSSAIAYDWWTSFGSAELDALMESALANNLDIKAGLHRIDQSRAALKINGADLYPSVDASAGASRSRSNPASGNTTTDTSLRAGLGVSYELDLFGANSARVAGSRANLVSTQFGQDALSLVVMGDVAQTYFNLLNARARLQIADTNLKNAREVLRIVQARFDAGSESEIELSQQRSILASREASRASVNEQVANAENALAVLLGQAPQTLTVKGSGLDKVSIPKIETGQPSTLLERRPDIRAAEADLIASNANIGVARAALFPSITLGLDWGVAAAGFGDPATTALSLASALAAPIFQGGRLEGGVEQATARQAELAETYRKTVLVSFQEVEDALAAVKAAQLRENALAAAMKESRTAYNLSRQRYEAGAIDFRTVLDTQDSLLSAEDSHAQAKLARLSAAIDLYKALGGGWASKKSEASQ